MYIYNSNWKQFAQSIHTYYYKWWKWISNRTGFRVQSRWALEAPQK